MFKNILIPTDGSEQSQRAVRTGVELAKNANQPYTAIPGQPFPSTGGPVPASDANSPNS